jgi:aminoglycoside phosphotransferase (APT) family kinase protein
VNVELQASLDDSPRPETLAAGLAHYLGAAVEGLRVLASGWETTLYEFALGSRTERLREIDVGTPLVLRLYPGAVAAEKGAREYRTISHLAPTGYPVPRPLLFEARETAVGAPFLVMARLRGGPLFAIRSFPQAFKTFSMGFLGFVRQQVRLHRMVLSPAAFIDFSAPPASSGPSPSPTTPASSASDSSASARLLDRTLAMIAARVEHGPLPGLAEAAAYLRQRAPQFRDGPTSVVHMDYHPQNVLVEGLRVTGIIDWASATMGDRHFDAATTSVILSTSAMEHPSWMQDNVIGRNLRRTFCALYLGLYHAIAPIEFRRLRYYQGVAGALRLSMLGMMRARGPESVGFRPGAISEVTPTLLRLLSAYVSRKTGAAVRVP